MGPRLGRVLVLLIVAGPYVLSAASEPEFRGGSLARDQRKLYAWGDGLWSIDISSRMKTEIAAGWFGEGGCVTDVNNDGKPDFILQRGRGLGELVWIDGRSGKPHLIDTAIDMHDCLAITLLGHKGFLIMQRGMQVRFYEHNSGDHWSETEIYSFYTPSYQTSFIPFDVDGDGYPDLFCGNYWMKSPERFDLPWHIFAINAYTETPVSAMLKVLLLSPGRLIVAQSDVDNARLTLFVEPQDPKQAWVEHRLDDDLHLAFVHALVSDGRGGFIAGERNGSRSRVIHFEFESNSGFRSRVIETGKDSVAFWRTGESMVILGCHDVRKITVQ